MNALPAPDTSLPDFLVDQAAKLAHAEFHRDAPHMAENADMPLADFRRAVEMRRSYLAALQEAGKQAAASAQATIRREPQERGERIQKLAALPAVEYDRQRQTVAAELGIRVQTLDAEVEKYRPHTAGKELQGEAAIFNEPEPWPDPVDGSEVLADVARTLASYVHLPAGAETGISLWIAASHCFEQFQHAPRLSIAAPTRGAGKTTLLNAIATLCPRALRTENLSVAVLFRVVAKHKPVLLADECDRYLHENPELVGLLNSGFTRGGVVLRCVGDDNEVRTFPVFGPVALSGIGSMPDTLRDRSIIIPLERAKPSELERRFDSRHVERETELKRKLARWALDNSRALSTVDPEMPAYNRAADTWRPLFCVAVVAGGVWPQRLAAALAALHPADLDNEPVSVQLLEDAAGIMDRAGLTAVSSSELIERLSALEERPWATWNRGKPVSGRQIARMLSGFGIHSATRRDGEAVFRGYARESFTDPLSRYGGVPSVTTLQPVPDKGSKDSASVTPSVTSSVTDSQTPEAASILGCNTVTLKTPPLTGGAPRQRYLPTTPLQSVTTSQPNGGAACDDVTLSEGGIGGQEVLL